MSTTATVHPISYNIVVVFQQLALNQYLRELVLTLLPGATPAITEIPSQLLAVAFPPHPITCQFTADGRLQVQDQRPNAVPGQSPFCDIAVKAIQQAKAAGNTNIAAFGFNFELRWGLPFGDDPKQFMRNRFFERSERLAKAFDGQVDDVGLMITIQRPDVRVQLVLERAVDRPGTLRVGANYHYDGTQPETDVDALRNKISVAYNHLSDSLRGIL